MLFLVINRYDKLFTCTASAIAWADITPLIILTKKVTCNPLLVSTMLIMMISLANTLGVSCLYRRETATCICDKLIKFHYCAHKTLNFHIYIHDFPYLLKLVYHINYN